MQATAKNTETARIQGTLTATAGMTAAQETTATSGDSRTDGNLSSRKEINNSGDACRQQQRTQQQLGFRER